MTTPTIERTDTPTHQIPAQERKRLLTAWKKWDDAKKRTDHLAAEFDRVIDDLNTNHQVTVYAMWKTLGGDITQSGLGKRLRTFRGKSTADTDEG